MLPDIEERRLRDAQDNNEIEELLPIEEAIRGSNNNAGYMFRPPPIGMQFCCRVRRKRVGGIPGFKDRHYELIVETQEGTRMLWLSARPTSRGAFMIYLPPAHCSDCREQKVGLLRSNYLGTCFSLRDPTEDNEELCILYETNILGLKGPRKITMLMPVTDSKGKVRRISRQKVNIESFDLIFVGRMALKKGIR